MILDHVIIRIYDDTKRDFNHTGNVSYCVIFSVVFERVMVCIVMLLLWLCFCASYMATNHICM